MHIIWHKNKKLPLNLDMLYLSFVTFFIFGSLLTYDTEQEG